MTWPLLQKSKQPKVNMTYKSSLLELELELLEEARQQQCAEDPITNTTCNGKWLQAALETLQYNSIPRSRFASLIVSSLKHGIGKGRTLMICGATNWAKFFMLLPPYRNLLLFYDTIRRNI